MAIKTYNPTSHGIRFRTGLGFEEITKTKPEKGLIEPLRRSGGRNNLGRVTSHHRGGGHKRLFRVIDFKRDKRGVPAKVEAIEYDPNRSSRLALLCYADGERRYILAPDQLKVGDKVMAGDEGVDIAFEAVGHTKEVPGVVNPVRGCIQAIRGGGKVCVLGLSSEPSPIVMKELIWKEGTIVTSRVSHGEFAETIENMNLGNLNPDALVTDILHPSQTQQAFEMLEKEPDKHLKILLKFRE